MARRQAWAYRGHGQKHDNQLFLGENRVSNERIEEPSQPATALFYERSVVRQVIAVDCGFVSKRCLFPQQYYSPATLLGGSRGRILNGYRLCRQSSSHTKSLYRRTTLLGLLELVTS